MSEKFTPRTDAMTGEHSTFHGVEMVSADFARQLERELSAEREKSRKLAADLAAEERGQDNLRRMIEAEREKVKALREALYRANQIAESMPADADISVKWMGWMFNHAEAIEDARATLEKTA